MTTIRIKGFKIFRDRHGKRRCYHRATGTPIDLVKYPFGSAEFFTECARIGRLVEEKTAPKPGTLGLLITEYRAHPAFRELAPRTRKDYQRCFDYLHPIEDVPLIRFNRPLIVRIRDKAAKGHGWRFANYVKAVLSIVFAWGAERGYLTENPATGVKNVPRPKNLPRANRPWTDEERFTVLDLAPWHLKVPIALGMYMGLREGDALTVTRSAYGGDWINTVTRKTRQRVNWPVPRALREILDAAPRHHAVTLAVNSRGRPWTESGFRASWRKFRLRLEQSGAIGPSLTFHGLRHTLATILREEGYDERSIADALGQATDSMARHYSRDADLKPKMQAMVRQLDVSENKRRARIVKPAS